ncbi:MAG: DUF3795 domain-containing protein [Sedimentisphaeraceae bacterium JB056]
MDQRMIAYCGLDCSECEAYQATKKEDIEKLKAVAEKWSAQFRESIDPEQVLCDGCKGGGRRSVHCKNDCKVRYCCLKKAIDSCIECEEYPCSEEKSMLETAPEAKSNLENLHSRIL